MAEERQRLTKEDIARQEEQELDKIRSQIPDLKIAHTLSDQNPLKKFLYNLENQTKPGPIYRAFCLFCLATIWVIQSAAFYYKNPSCMIMLLVTLPMTYVIVMLIRSPYSQKNIRIISSFPNMPRLFNRLLLILFLFFILASIFYDTSNAGFLSQKIVVQSSPYLYVVYLFIITLCLSILFLFNDLYSLYEVMRIRQVIVGRNYAFIIFVCFLLLLSPALFALNMNLLFQPDIYGLNRFFRVFFNVIGQFSVFYIAASIVALLYYQVIRVLARTINRSS